MAPPRFLPEARVLLPRDPSITDSDDWSEFILNDARVTLRGGNQKDLVSLLLAHANYPLRVTGRLQTPSPEDEQAHLFRPKYRASSRSISTSSGGSVSRRRGGGATGAIAVQSQSHQPQQIDVELAEVRSFAYGAYPDGGIEIWAAGEAGWFLLRPARAYKAIFNEMVEAVNVLYFVVDAYSTQTADAASAAAKRRRNRLPSVRQLFLSFSREIDGDAEDAAARVYRHREFLLGCMMSDREGIAWEGLPIFVHLAEKFPEDVERIRARWAEESTVEQATNDVFEAHSASEKPAVSSNSLKRKRGRPGTTEISAAEPKEPTSGAPPGSEDNSTTSRKRSTKSQKGISSLTPHRVQGSSRGTISDSAPDSPSTPIADSDIEMHAFRSKNKSALRLKPSKPMKGMKGLQTRTSSKGGKGAAQAVSEDDEPDEDEDNDDERTDIGIEQPSFPPPKLSGPGSKRRRDNDFFPPTQLNPLNKISAVNNSKLDEGIDIPSSPASSTSSTHIPDNSTLLHTTTTSTSQSQPDQPERFWTCALAGCTHRIPLGPSPSTTATGRTNGLNEVEDNDDDDDPQAKIREHYALHAYDDDARVRLVRDLAAPALPAGHLLERVKMQARWEGFPGSAVAGTRFPVGLRRDFSS